MNYHAAILRSYHRQLQVLRNQSGLTQEAIARAMQVSSAKVSRMFSYGRPVLSLADVTMLMDVLGAPDDLKAELLATWAKARNSRPALADFRDILSPNEIEYYEATQWADVAWINGACSIPLIIAVPEVHEAMMRSQNMSALKAERWRQLLPLIQVQQNPNRELNIILDESVFLRWNMPGFHDQMDALLAAHQAGTCIQVIPLDTGTPIAAMQPFTILLWDSDPLATLMCIGWAHKPVDWVTPEPRRREVTGDWNHMVANGTNPNALPAIVEMAHRQRESGLRTVIPR
jgi:transcriptional regulator with XRE-family HTH domain